MLYDDDKEKRKSFYGSPVDRGNKKILEEFASQVYSYINSSISEYADTDDYRFRVWTEVKVNQKSGRIIDQPIFNVDTYRYVGRIAARPVESEGYSVKTIFVGKKDDIFISPFMSRALRKAKGATRYLELEMYVDPSSAPPNVKSKVVKSFPTLILQKESFAIRSKNSADGTSIIPYIDDDGEQFELADETALIRFIARESGLKPEILGFETGFQRVDDEVQKIAETVRESAAPETSSTSTRNLIEVLGLDLAFKNLTVELDKQGDWKAEDADKTLKRLRSELEEQRKAYTLLKTEHNTELEHLQSLIEENKKGRLDFDKFDAARVKSLFNKNDIEEKLVEIQENVKGDLTSRIRAFTNNRKPISAAKSES